MRHPIYDLMKTNIGVDNDSPTEFIARAGNGKSKRSPFKAVYFPKGRGFAYCNGVVSFPVLSVWNWKAGNNLGVLGKSPG